jgi:hypothetical protein
VAKLIVEIATTAQFDPSSNLHAQRHPKPGGSFWSAGQPDNSGVGGGQAVLHCFVRSVAAVRCIT